MYVFFYQLSKDLLSGFYSALADFLLLSGKLFIRFQSCFLHGLYNSFNLLSFSTYNFLTFPHNSLKPIFLLAYSFLFFTSCFITSFLRNMYIKSIPKTVKSDFSANFLYVSNTIF